MPQREIHPSASRSITQEPEALVTEDDAARYVGLHLWSGTGELLGTVTGIEEDRWGRPKHLRFVEPGGAETRRAPLRVVRRIETDGIHLAGPREGYHITRLG